MSCPFQTALADLLPMGVLRTISSRVRPRSLELRLMKLERVLNWVFILFSVDVYRFFALLRMTSHADVFEILRCTLDDNTM